MNYKHLLIKHINNVIDSEGVSFINTGCSCMTGISDEERQELEHLDEFAQVFWIDREAEGGAFKRIGDYPQTEEEWNRLEETYFGDDNEKDQG